MRGDDDDDDDDDDEEEEEEDEDDVSFCSRNSTNLLIAPVYFFWLFFALDASRISFTTCLVTPVGSIIPRVLGALL